MRMKNLLRSLYYGVTGRGAGFLAHKQEYHQRRAAAEREVLARPSAFRENSCPSCGGRAGERFTNPIGFSFACCPVDGTVYMDPVPTDETLRELYNSPAMTFLWTKDREPDDVPPRPKDGPELDALLRMLPAETSRRRLLDVGCATGGFLATAQVRFEVAGVEINGKTAEVARRHGYAVTTGTISDLPAGERFDVISLLQVVEHLVDPASVLRGAVAHLKPGGHIYLSTPNIASASFEVLRERHVHVASFGHVSLFGQPGLAALARRSGLELVGYETWGGRDFALHDALTWRLARRRFAHRMALYSGRLYHLSELADSLSLGLLGNVLGPSGDQSYQRALLRRA
jgi:2-polyprenyl-3-methyl-5-hydroxy-6-metoxy-1,4-benzoquinol methylase